MKSNRFFAAAVAAFVFAGCVKENQPVDQVTPDVDTPKGELITLDFTASLDPDVKTTFGPMADDKLPVVWEANDKLAVFVGYDSYSDIAITIDAENTKKAYFSAAIEAPAEGDKMVVFYPSQGSSITEDGVQFVLDAQQLAAGNGLPKRIGNYQPLAAAVADAGDAQTVVAGGGSTLSFKNVFAAIRFTFPANDIMSISFKGNDEEDVAGTCVIAPDGTIANVTDGQKSVTMKTSDNKAFKAEYGGTALAYQLLVLPQTFEKGFTLTMTTADGLTFQKSTSNPLALDRSDIVYLGEIKTTGITAMERVWGLYKKPVNGSPSPIFGADGQLPEVSSNNWGRNVTMDDNYIYIPHFGGSKVYALNYDGSFAKVLDNTGISGGYSTTTAARVMSNGASTVLLVSNMAGAGGHSDPLRVYAYDTPDSAPRLVLEYAQSGQRLGDKFTIEGDWQNGKLYFYSMSSSKVYVFKVEGGVINNVPSEITLSSKPGAVVGVYSKFSDSEYVWSGSGVLPRLYNESGTIVTSLSESQAFTIPTHDMAFFSYNGVRYLANIQLLNSYQDATINVSRVSSATLNSVFAGLTKDFHFGLGDPKQENITAYKNGNGVGGCEVRTVNGITYIAACVPGAGVSLFKVK